MGRIRGRVAAVARADVSASAAAVLRDPGAHAGITHDLTGPQPLTLAEVAEAIGRARGAEVTFHDVTVEEAYESRTRWPAPSWQYDASTRVSGPSRWQAGGMTRAAQSPGVVDALVAAGLVDAGRRDEAQRVVAGALVAPETARTSSRSLLVEIAAYVGGALVVASLVLFLAQQWPSLSDTAQVAALATIAALLAVAGASAARVGGGVAPLRAGRDDVRRRLTAALLTATALAAAVTVGRVVDLQIDERTGNESWPVLAGAVTMLVIAALAYAFVASVLGQLAMLGAVFMGVTSGWSLFDEMQNSTLWPGLAFLVIGLGWLALAERGRFHEVWEARAIGAATTLWGAQFVRFGDDHNALAYALMLTVAVAAFAMYLRTVSWPYLVVGVLGITLVVPEAIIDWTEGSLGPAGGVLVAGLTLLGASLAGFRVRKEATEDQKEAEDATSLG